MIKRLVGVVGMSLAGMAFAEPFDAKVVPAEAKWVVHVDVDAVVKSSFWPMIQKKLDTTPGARQKLSEIETVAGMNIKENLHSVTLFGAGFNESDGVILINAKTNQDQIMGMLQINAAYASQPYGIHEIVSWEDKGKTMFGSFFASDRVVIAQMKTNVAKALDILDGKGESIKADSILAQASGAGVLAGIAGDGISQLAGKDKKNPVLKNVRSAWLSLGQTGNEVTLKGSFNVGDEKKAVQMKALADGAKALGTLAANQENADPKIKAIAPLFPTALVTAQGPNVMINWTVPFEQVSQLVDQVAAARSDVTQNAQ